jgi:hypothetical protein
MKRRKVQAQGHAGALKPGNSHRMTNTAVRIGHPRLPRTKPAGRRGKLANIFFPSTLSPDRVRFAYAVAVLGDVVQLAIGLFDSYFPADMVGMLAVLPAAVVALLLIPALGFHVLLLPTVVLEMVPKVNTLPAFTACVALVVALRKK